MERIETFSIQLNLYIFSYFNDYFLGLLITNFEFPGNPSGRKKIFGVSGVSGVRRRIRYNDRGVSKNLVRFD